MVDEENLVESCAGLVSFRGSTIGDEDRFNDRGTADSFCVSDTADVASNSVKDRGMTDDLVAGGNTDITDEPFGVDEDSGLSMADLANAAEEDCGGGGGGPTSGMMDDGCWSMGAR